MAPLISIIIPVYNSARFIEPCIRSVLEQSYQNLEVIIVDDCSEDNTLDLINGIYSEYPGRAGSLKVVHHTENRGVSSARKTGIKAAKGVFVQTMDADDVIDSVMVEQMHRLITLNEADVAICGYTRDMDFRDKVELEDVRIEDHMEMMEKALFFDSKAIFLWNKLFRKELFERWDLSAPEKLTNHEDYNVMYKVFWHVSKVVSCNNKYYHWRENPSSAGRTFKRIYRSNTWAYLESVSEMSRFFKENKVGSGLDAGRLLYQKIILVSMALYGDLSVLKQNMSLFEECTLRSWLNGRKKEMMFFAKVVGISARYRCWPIVRLARLFVTQ